MLKRSSSLRRRVPLPWCNLQVGGPQLCRLSAATLPSWIFNTVQILLTLYLKLRKDFWFRRYSLSALKTKPFCFRDAVFSDGNHDLFITVVLWCNRHSYLDARLTGVEHSSLVCVYWLPHTLACSLKKIALPYLSGTLKKKRICFFR